MHSGARVNSRQMAYVMSSPIRYTAKGILIQGDVLVESKTFTVSRIGCDGCVRTVTSELGQLAGVTHVEANKDTKLVTIEWSAPANWQQIQTRLADINYPCDNG